MPYRRLPKTDKARLKALEALADNNDVYTVEGRFIGREQIARAQKIYALLSDAVGQYTLSMRTQVRYSKRILKLQHNAAMYLSHFLQVLFLAVDRGEIPAGDLSYYDIDADNRVVPYLKTPDAVAEWAPKVIKGEKARMKKGGKPILSPSIGQVATHWDVFRGMYDAQKQYQTRTVKALNDINSLRPQADEVILDLWNTIEKHYENEPPEKRFNLCRKYGIVYYYRRHEKHLY